MEFQHRVSAYCAVRVLAEQEGAGLWDLPVRAALQYLYCETGHPVDDLLVGTNEGGVIFLQAKRKLSLSAHPSSDLASVLGQFVRQFLTNQAAGGQSPWERPLDPVRDRLVLATGPTSPAAIREHLRAALDRLRSLLPSQPLDEAAVNAPQKKAVGILTGQVRRLWKEATGKKPSDEELRALLKLIRVDTLHLEAGQANEALAKQLLKSAILQDPDQADAAWAFLIQACADFAAKKSGGARPDLQLQLLKQGLGIKAAPSYQRDIQTLRDHSARVAALNRGLARIRAGSREIVIQRQATAELRRLAEEASLLVVGEPGAGKSGALFELYEGLAAAGRDTVYLDVHRLDTGTMGAISQGLRLDHELPDVLMNWPGNDAAILVIDALDAARGGPAERALRDLIQLTVEATGRWRVIASIRKFDLRYSPELHRLFALAGPPEAPATLRDPEFSSVRHLNVPPLTDGELAQVRTQSPELGSLLQAALRATLDLCRTPFNLRLMADLLGSGTPLDTLTPITTQLQLLESYWGYRVKSQDYAREQVLQMACEGMIETRSLRLRWDRLAQSGLSEALSDLLETNVLMQWEPAPGAPPDQTFLLFAHQVLFDFAVARLILREEPAALVSRLASRHDLILMVRPSLLLHFRHLWLQDPDRHRFWDLVLKMMAADGVREIGRVIGPSVAAELARNLAEFEALAMALGDQDATCRVAADRTLRHLVFVILAKHAAGHRLVGPGAGPWCALLERLTDSPRMPIVLSLGSLLSTLDESPALLTQDQRHALGEAARTLLAFTWNEVPGNAWLKRVCLRAVCRTYESAPSESGALLRRALAPAHMREHAHDEMFWLARHSERLVTLDPDLVAEIYRAILGHHEPSREPTSMGASRLLPLVSNRQQDVQMGQYELGELFPKFLERAPIHATEALISVLESYVARAHSYSSAEQEEWSFRLGEVDARLRSDYSSVWDRDDLYRHDDPIKMLNAFEDRLGRLAEGGASVELVRDILRTVAIKNRLAVLWRRLLRLGARFPEAIGLELRGLGWALPVLKARDTWRPAREFIAVVFPKLSPEERTRVEEAVLFIPDSVPDDRREVFVEIRNDFLRSLTEDALTTPAVRETLANLEREEPSEPEVAPTLSAGVRIRDTEEEFLARHGVDIDSPPNRELRQLEAPVMQFAKGGGSPPPPITIAEARAILPALEGLLAALERADAEGVHPLQSEHAWDELGDACARIVRIEQLSCRTRLGVLCRNVILHLSRHPNPEADEETESAFNASVGWSTPAPRIQAAEGIVDLARHRTCQDQEVLRTVRLLSVDRHPAVRYLVGRSLVGLYRNATTLMWEILRDRCGNEENRGVLEGIVRGTLYPLARRHTDDAVALARSILDRVQHAEGSVDVREACIHLLADFYIWRGHQPSRGIILGIVADPVSAPEDANSIAGRFRESLTFGPVSPSTPAHQEIRQRAFLVVGRLLKAIRETAAPLVERQSQLSDPERDRLQSMLRLVDHVGREVYFASGAYQGGSREVPRASADRFYHEAGEVLDDLADVGFPSVAHHFLETLEHFVSLEPRGVFLRVARAVGAGRAWGYQYESQAADLVVKLVERYLADHRTLMREDEECRVALLDLLDVFVEAGWPQAHQVTIRLDEIFR